MDGNSIVISGISGRFPGCDNTDELLKAMVEGRDLVSDYHGRWAKDFYGLNNRAGIIKDIENFDNQFWGVPPRQADGLDPRTRLLMEATFEAIVDAGVNPINIKGSNTGVFIGMTTSRGRDSVFENKVNYTRLGRSMAMTSGMISFMFDLRGPSYALDTACSSSLYAFCQAFRAIKGGECDAAIVCGASIVLDPYDSLEYKTMNILSPTGKCQFLDENRDGFVKSESIVVTYLQKSRDAKRIYATVRGCGTNTDGFKMEGVTKPSTEVQRDLLESVYTEFGINPLDVTYMEAHGTGTKVGDLEETKSISEFLCKDRNEPLLIGSCKTNIGHTEMASGVTSIIKVVLSMEKGVLPPVIHLNKIGEDIIPVHEGLLKPVTELTPWKGGLMGVNSFGVGGTNAHVVLEPNLKTNKSKASIPNNRLVLVAGRTEKGLQNMMELVKNHRFNPEIIALLDNLFYNPLRMYDHRGYVLLDQKILEETYKTDREERQVWFVYSGIGSQWPGMGKDLMNLDIFKISMEECAESLRPYNIDLIKIVTTGNEETFKNVTNCFISIVAVSICLTDFLKCLGIEPDGLIGHSVGEVCCAYADGLITKSEAMLIARARGVALQSAPSIEGTLAVVGLTKEEADIMLPKDIYIACYNCVDNITISGPRKSIAYFVKTMKSNGKFAEIIQGAGMAYHSKYIAEAGDILDDLLRDIIREKKPLSKKWISSSVVLEEVSQANEKNEGIQLEQNIIHCPEYHRNNLINSVHFHSAMEKVPEDAIVIEISPKGLLQTVIRRNLGKDAKIVALSAENAEYNDQYLLSAIGKLYLAGLNPDIRNINSKFNVFPVSRGTPSLASLIDWDRNLKCKVSYYSPEQSFGECVAIDLMDPTMQYLEGHMIEGKIIFPVMGYVYLAWEIFARMNKKPVSEVPVIIENVKIRRMTLLPKDEAVIFNVNILNSTGDFEVSESGSLVCFGSIKSLENGDKAFTVPLISESQKLKNDFPDMDQEDVYDKLRRFGFQYRNLFQGILKCKGQTGKLNWSNHWIAFLDSAIHYTAVANTFQSIFLPESVGKIIIDPEAHLALAAEYNNQIPLEYDDICNIIQCGKLEIRDLQLIELFERKSLVKPKLEKHQFLPYSQTPKVSLYTCLYLVLQIALENTKDFSTLKILELHDSVEETEESENEFTTFSKTLKSVISEEMVMKIIHDRYETVKESDSLDNYDLVIINKDSTPNGMLKRTPNTFFLMKQNSNFNTKKIIDDNFVIVSKFSTDESVMLLIRQKQPLPKKPKIISITLDTFEWVNELKTRMQELDVENPEHIYLVSEKEETNGIMGLFTCLRYEDKGAFVKIVFLADKKAEKFSFDSNFYKTQLEKGLNVNVLKNSSWGSYRYLDYEKIETILTDKAHAEVLAQGDFSSIKMVENFPYSDNMEIQVYFAGMNFKDVLIANGALRLPGTHKNNFKIGYEFSGKTPNGKRVFGIMDYHTFGTVVAPENPLWDVPDEWSLEEAASVPLIYLTLYYAFDYRTQLEAGKSILIHSAAGGVGMAAIQMALSRSCVVFATVGNDAKKEFLLKEFPQLDEENIFNSHDDTFEMKVKRKTNGRGVDIVLNSLVGNLFNASLRCVATNGDFIEIGKSELLLHNKIESKLFLKSTSLHAVSIDEALGEDRVKINRFHRVFAEDLKKGIIKPIPYRKVFDIENIAEAFEYFQTGIHVGKIILKVRDEEKILNMPPSPKIVHAIPRLSFNPKKSYIIIGGLGGLALELAFRMSILKAKHIFLVSRSPPKNGHQLNSIYSMRVWGTQVFLRQTDTSDIRNAEKLINEANTIAPVGGIFNLAMVNKDNILENQTVEAFEEVFKPKGLITKNFDILTRKLCPKLDHFVGYSSATCGRGNLGQTNYGFANSTMERIIEKRNEENLPGLVIQWGPMGDIGYFAKTSKKEELGFYIAQPIQSYIEVIKEYFLNTTGILSSTVQRDIVQSIQVGDSLLESVMKLFGITSLEKVEDDTTLLELGIDSLMGFEIKQYLYREHDIDITVKDLRNKTISDIKEIDKKRKK